MDQRSTITRLEGYIPDLGPHAGRLMGEMLAAQRAGLDATVIILAVAVLDVALREPSGYPAGADGIDLAAARDSRDAFWLRERRNGIVHFEGGRGGLMGDEEAALKLDAIRAMKVLAEALDLLMP
ncbi:hypothetical protein AB8880_03375 [Alphaproteobacteria bacterium LSUCC0684]